MPVKIKRAYEVPSADDGERILVDRLWPRGLSKEQAHLDLWLKEIAPSTELRVWFRHDPDRWRRFRRLYKAELTSHDALLKLLAEKARSGTITLIYAARDKMHNEAKVLKQLLDKLIKPENIDL